MLLDKGPGRNNYCPMKCYLVRMVLLLCVAPGLAVVCQPAAGRELTKITDSVVDPAALYFTRASWGNCVNGQTFQQDAVASCNGYQYATYYDSARRLCVARRAVGKSAWEVIRFEDHHLKGNDTHNVAVLGI